METKCLDNKLGRRKVATCLLSALHYAAAAWKNNPEVARMLLLHPTMDSANAKTNGGETAVMRAVIFGYKEVLMEVSALILEMWVRLGGKSWDLENESKP